MYGKNPWLIGTDSDISVLKAAGGDTLTSLTAVTRWAKCSPAVMLTH